VKRNGFHILGKNPTVPRSANPMDNTAPLTIRPNRALKKPPAGVEPATSGLQIRSRKSKQTGKPEKFENPPKSWAASWAEAAEITAAWPHLPPAIRAGILAMVRAASGAQK
jgi:hypothetical protein